MIAPTPARLLGALLALPVACAAPEGPPSPDERLLPPHESAASCPPVGTPLFPQRSSKPNGYLADLDEGVSCGIYLEQDECVVAIFKDCTHSGRQWIGTTIVEGTEIRLNLTPSYDPAPQLAPPKSCTGVFTDPAAPRASAFLSCMSNAPKPHRGLYLEAYDESRVTFAEYQPLESIPIGSFQKMNAIESATSVTRSTGTELWLAVNWDGGSAGGGVWRIGGTVARPNPQFVDTTSNVYMIDAGGGRVVYAHGKLARHEVTVADNEDPAPLATITVDGEVRALAATSDDRFLIATSSSAFMLRLVARTAPETGYRLERVGSTFVPRQGHYFTAAEWTRPASPAAAPFMLSTTQQGDGEESELIGLEDDLSVRWRSNVIDRFDVKAMAVLPDRDRVGVVLLGGGRDYEGPDQSNQYYEIHPSDGTRDPVIPIPYFYALEALSYDRPRDRVYVADHFGDVTYIDRTHRRAEQGWASIRTIETEELITITAAVWDESRQRLMVVDPRRGVVDSFKLADAGD